jgi:hypothetical protein
VRGGGDGLALLAERNGLRDPGQQPHLHHHHHDHGEQHEQPPEQPCSKRQRQPADVAGDGEAAAAAAAAAAAVDGRGGNGSEEEEKNGGGGESGAVQARALMAMVVERMEGRRMMEMYMGAVLDLHRRGGVDPWAAKFMLYVRACLRACLHACLVWFGCPPILGGTAATTAR